jgi:two-component system, chemotaxis family, response regulator Rcp1
MIHIMKTAIDVLLVDDNPGDTELTADLLKRHEPSMNIQSVSDGVEAMVFLRRQEHKPDAFRPHLIMLDLNMPRRDGWAVLVEVKSDSALKAIPLVVFTTSEARNDIVRCYELGANSYVTKPGNLDAYTATVTGIANYWFGFASLVRREGQ